MLMTHTHMNRGAVDRISDSIRQVIAGADSSSDIHDVVESARAALLDAEAVSLFGLETPHPDFGSVHWIVGRTEPPDGDFLVFAIPERAPDEDRDDAGWSVFTGGGDDLGEAFRQLPPGFVAAPPGHPAPGLATPEDLAAPERLTA